MPARRMTFFASLLTQSPTPFGAGKSLIRTEPALPSISTGTLCASPQEHSHEPHDLRTGIMFSFAFSVAFSIATRFSVETDLPMPTYPLPLPTTTIADMRYLRPERC